MDTPIIVAFIGAIGTVTAALIPAFMDKSADKDDARNPSNKARSSPRSRIALILLLGMSLTANAILFAAVRPLSQPTAINMPEAASPDGSANPIVETVGDTVKMTCPPGYYVNGITYSLQPGGKHGQVYTISPLIKPLP